MMRLAISPAAAGLYRALVSRSGLEKNRVLLSSCRSTDWQSLTFIGERHRIVIRLAGESADDGYRRLVDGLANAELAIPGHIVADIVEVGVALPSPDGSIDIEIEALTIES